MNIAENVLFNFKETNEILEQCKLMLVSQRDSFKKYMDDGRRAFTQNLIQIQQLTDQLELAKKEISALKQVNTKLATERNAIPSIPHGSTAHGRLTKDESNNKYERLRMLIITTLSIPLEQHATLKNEEIKKCLSARFEDHATQRNCIKAKKANAKATTTLSTVTHQTSTTFHENKKVKELQKLIEEQNQQLDQLKRQNTALHIQTTEVGRIVSENAELRAEVDRLRGDTVIYKASIGALKAAKQYVNADQRAVYTAQNAKIEQMEKEIKRLKDEVEKEKVEHELTRETMQQAVRNISVAGREALAASEAKLTKYKDYLQREVEKYTQLEEENKANGSYSRYFEHECTRASQNVDFFSKRVKTTNRNKTVIAELRDQIREFEAPKLPEDVYQSPPPSSSNNKRYSPYESIHPSPSYIPAKWIRRN
ncbi:hypothetical protein BDA99DRAFT_570470 [Phascolomyces articulosus]|uniref:Uncharacterized protein n=1 Tax=Phascolomyces articulosus TaxID=60185 RepID=A0AAD5PGN2_9FUNG|nr:hypothetical protein BDA99DRAFT_570470 [Phascolomyces articulosus]